MDLELREGRDRRRQGEETLGDGLRRTNVQRCTVPLRVRRTTGPQLLARRLKNSNWAGRGRTELD